MAAGPTPTMTVLHLATGQVLAAVTCGSHAVNVDDLTGGTHLTVRLPGSEKQVLVTPDLLTASVVPRDDDVLDRPLDFRFGDGTPAVTYAGTPVDIATDDLGAPEGTPVVSLWQTGDGLEVARGSVTASHQPDGTAPPGATHRLIACQSGPLGYGTTP
jgi:hypothetical protein